MSAAEDNLARLTEEDFRACGWTADAINHPISWAAFLYRCWFNGIDPGQAPMTWHYAPNEWVQRDLNEKGKDRPWRG